jgi:hypothetical protein
VNGDAVYLSPTLPQLCLGLLGAALFVFLLMRLTWNSWEREYRRENKRRRD